MHMRVNFVSLKCNFSYENYLHHIKFRDHRVNFTKMCISNHLLNIEGALFKARPIVPRDERWCPHCLSLGHKSIEDEEHFLCEDKLGLKNDLSGNSLFMFLINS
jgi:hypothetical protein